MASIPAAAHQTLQTAVQALRTQDGEPDVSAHMAVPSNMAWVAVCRLCCGAPAGQEAALPDTTHAEHVLGVQRFLQCTCMLSRPVCLFAGERANEEREQALNQLLSEMDGFTPEEGIVFVAATNRADLLDPALMRAGRFDRKIRLNRPDAAAREEILRVRAPVNSCLCLSLGSGVYLPSCLLSMLACRDTRKVAFGWPVLPTCMPVLHTTSSP